MGKVEMALLREIYADWSRSDYTRTDCYHPDFELVFAPDFLDEGAFRGLEEAGRGWRGWFSQWSSWITSPERYVELGDGRIAAIVHIHGVSRTTGLELSQQGGNVWEFDDGLARRLVI